MLIRRLLLPVLLVGTLAVTAAPPVAAAAPPSGEAIGVGRQRLTAEPPAASTSGFSDALCSPDPAGDTVYTDDAGDDVTEPFPPADLREFCGDYADTLTLRLRTAEPSDPTTDPAWDGETYALWFLDTGGGGYDYATIYALDGQGQPAVQVFELLPDGSEELRCDASPAFEEGFLVARGIPAACIGAPDRVDVAAITAYEDAVGTAAARVYFDMSDTFAAVGRTGSPTRRELSRLAGANRIETAVEISQRAFANPPAAGTAYLARADSFPDALAAGSLTDGPILLVPGCGALPAVVATELDRLDPGTVTALGGEAAVCDDLLDDAAGTGVGGREQTRLAKAAPGNTRFGTAVAISEQAFPDGATEVYLATGEDFPDALAAGSLTTGPLLLVPRCGELPEVVAGEIDRLDPERVLALGGERAVCSDLLTEAAGGRNAERLAGSTRFETAAAIAGFTFPDGAREVFLARADDFPDALAAGVLTSGPVLLVPSCGGLPTVTAQALRDLSPTRVTALGGQGAVCETMLRHAGNA